MKLFSLCSVDKVKVLSLMLHAADISHPAKAWPLHERWTHSLMEEFFRQVRTHLWPLIKKYMHSNTAHKYTFEVLYSSLFSCQFVLLLSDCDIQIFAQKTYKEFIKYDVLLWIKLYKIYTSPAETVD